MTDSDAQRTIDALANADRLEEAGDLSSAVEELSQAIASDPTNARLRAHRGRLFHLLEDWGQALQDFDAALDARPDANTTRFFRARARSMSGDLDGALRDFEECTRRDPDAADAFYECGLIHEFRGDLQQATAAFERADGAVAGGFRDARSRVSHIRNKL